MQSLRRYVPVLLVGLGLVVLVRIVAGRPVGDVVTPSRLPEHSRVTNSVARIDVYFQKQYRQAGLQPAPSAADLTVLRRLSLSLHGTLPSLEEVRQFEADEAEERLERWTERMLRDDRFADYFSGRLSRSLVGVEEGPFLLFRRDRLNHWLGQQLKDNRPWDAVARDLISSTGLWTGHPATNYVTATLIDNEVNEEKLAGRTVRAFLGQRIDCAQCHDHPFADWKQAQFQGLAAFFGQTRVTALGVEDSSDAHYTVNDAGSEPRQVVPAVPFGADWRTRDGTTRHQLAGWLTHPDNRRFDRAIVNRVWGLLHGRPYISPVDDLPDPGDSRSELIDILADDFRNHHRDLKRLIHVITACRPFRLSSRPGEVDARQQDYLEEQWAVFPMVRLRPEQVVGSMLQAASVKTIDRNSHLLVRLLRFTREQNFVQEYGDLGEEELEGHASTIPQALLKMNGQLGRELIENGAFSTAGRIAAATLGNDPLCLETCYLSCLGRRPSTEETDFFSPWLTGTQGEKRHRAVEDIFWALFNSPEFSWNH